MNARLRMRLLRRQPRVLPPPAVASPAPFGSIIRHTTRPRSRAVRASAIVLLAGTALAAIFLCTHAFFRFLIFGGT